MSYLIFLKKYYKIYTENKKGIHSKFLLKRIYSIMVNAFDFVIKLCGSNPRKTLLCALYMAPQFSNEEYVPVTHEVVGAKPTGVAIENAPVSDGLKLNKMQT